MPSSPEHPHTDDSFRLPSSPEHPHTDDCHAARRSPEHPHTDDCHAARRWHVRLFLLFQLWELVILSGITDSLVA